MSCELHPEYQEMFDDGISPKPRTALEVAVDTVHDVVIETVQGVAQFGGKILAVPRTLQQLDDKYNGYVRDVFSRFTSARCTLPHYEDKIGILMASLGEWRAKQLQRAIHSEAIEDYYGLDMIIEIGLSLTLFCDNGVSGTGFSSSVVSFSDTNVLYGGVKDRGPKIVWEVRESNNYDRFDANVSYGKTDVVQEIDLENNLGRQG